MNRETRLAIASAAIGALLALGALALLAHAIATTGGPPAADERVADEPEEDTDPPEVAIGERLFLETRFAQFFFAHSAGDANAELPAGDPVMDTTQTTGAPLIGPFAGASMNCRACHLVDEQSGVPGGGNRTYADFARRSPLPAREDGLVTTPRNSPPLVNASLRRPDFLAHFDGEFSSLEDLIRSTLTGRNFGWLPREHDVAVAHIAHVIRDDDGTGDLAQEYGGALSVVLAGTDPSIPPEFVLPAEFRIAVTRASDAQILDAVAGLIAAYVRSLVFAQSSNGAFSGSPFDVFLAKNGLPRKPAAGESNLDYSRRLRQLVASLANVQYVTPADGTLLLHDQPFVFGPTELTGLRVFLTEPVVPLNPVTIPAGGVGNCVVCHPAPVFTDFAFHNTGVSQIEYDGIHGDGAFAALGIPWLAARTQRPNAFLPPTPEHPNAQGPFCAAASIDNPGHTDLGLWNVFANPDFPLPQKNITAILCTPAGTRCRRDALLDQAVARFKTPGLRDLGHSGPYFHNGGTDTLGDTAAFYARVSNMARAGQLRNGAPELANVALTAPDVDALAAFLQSLNEDYQ